MLDVVSWGGPLASHAPDPGTSPVPDWEDDGVPPRPLIPRRTPEESRLLADIGLRVQRLRRDTELTRPQLATLTGWSVTKVATIEHGRYAVSVLDATTLARILGSTPGWVAYGINGADQG